MVVLPARRSVGAAGAALALVAGLVGCGDDGEAGDVDPAGAASGTVTVLAGSSLAAAFESIAGAFEAEHDGVDVALGFGGSSGLAAQVLGGAPADVFVSADEPNLAAVADAGLAAGDPVTIATNHLAIAVGEGNPSGVGGLADLLHGELRVALCAPEVPCGRYAAAAFDRLDLDQPAASQESSVRGVLTKVALGEADAGVVYATDAASTDGIEAVAVEAAAQVLVGYHATLLEDAPNPPAAAAFLAFLRGPVAQAILRAAGFGAP